MAELRSCQRVKKNKTIMDQDEVVSRQDMKLYDILIARSKRLETLSRSKLGADTVVIKGEAASAGRRVEMELNVSAPKGISKGRDGSVYEDQMMKEK